MPKAIVLAGGFGTRLKSAETGIPKPLVDINGRTLTEHVFDILRKSGIKDIILSIHYEAEKIRDYFGDGKKFGLNISYAYEETPLGTAGPLVVLSEDNMQLKEDFFMLNGDVLFDEIDLNSVMDFHRKHNALATIILAPVEDVSSFGVAKMNGELVEEFIEKPAQEDAPSNLVNTGYYIISPEVFDIAMAVYREKGKVMMEHNVFPRIASMSRLYGFVHNNYWQDTGTPERLRIAREKFK